MTAPSFEDASASFLVGSGVGNTLVGTAAATDTNAISYSLVGDDAGSFAIDETSGEIKIAGVGTPLSDGTYSVTVVATDAAGNSASHDVTITVDVTAPSFEDASASFLVGSGAGNTLVGTAAATDANAISYSLVGDDAGSFVIDGVGAISIASVNTSLSDGVYEVTIVATDAVGNSASHDVTITVETPEAILLQYLNKTVFGAADGQVSYFVGSVFDPQASIDSYVVLSGSLPTGISMAESTGQLTGTLALASIYTAESFEICVDVRSGVFVVYDAPV